MKDKECKAHIHTYKCDEKSCERCEYRYSNDIINKLKEIAFQTDCVIYKGDVVDDYYIRLSDVIDIVEREM